MIPKTGKDHDAMKGYRLLSLTSCLGKLSERIVKHGKSLYKTKPVRRSTKRLQIWQMQNRQSANTNRKNFNWKGATAAAFLDLEQALDSVCHEGILYKQIHINTPKMDQQLPK